MLKNSPVFRQFITVACCEYLNLAPSEHIKRLSLLKIGNLVTLSFGLSDGWITINYLELQNENTTLSTGPLTSDQLPFVISIANIGGIVGNFVIVPLSRAIGTKRSIHLLVIPLIVRKVQKVP